MAVSRTLVLIATVVAVLGFAFGPSVSENTPHGDVDVLASVGQVSVMVYLCGKSKIVC